MPILYIFESFLYFLYLLLISIKIFDGIPSKLKIVISLITTYTPFIILSLTLSYEELLNYNLLVYLLTIISLKISVKNITFKALLFSFILLFTVNTMLTAIFRTLLSKTRSTALIIELIIHLCILLICVIICFSKVGQRIKTIITFTPKSIKFLITAIMIFSMLIFGLVFDSEFYGSNSSWVKVVQLLLVLLVSFVCLSFPIMVLSSVSNAYLKKLKSDYERQIKIQTEHYTALSRANFEFRRFRHDFKNIKIGVRECITDGKYDDALKMLDLSNEQIYAAADSLLDFDTGNGIIDALLADKQRQANQYGTKITFEGAVTNGGISSTELCILFGNTLDNAIEACEKVETQNRVINIFCSCNSGFMFLTVKNPVDRKVEIRNNRIATTKADKSMHGFGLYSLGLVVENHDGSLTFNSNENIFTVEISLCLDSNQQHII